MTRRSALITVAPLLMLSACATRSPARPALLSLEVYAMPAGAAAVQTLAPGGRLRSGDRFAVRVEADAPVYGYLVHAAAGEKDELIAPAPGAAPLRLAPGTPTHLPGGDAWYGTDQHPGTEWLFLVASPRPLDPAQALAAARQKPAADAERTRGEPPPDVPEKGRGERVQAVLRRDGTTVLRFWFRHE